MGEPKLSSKSKINELVQLFKMHFRSVAEKDENQPTPVFSLEGSSGLSFLENLYWGFCVVIISIGVACAFYHIKVIQDYPLTYAGLFSTIFFIAIFALVNVLRYETKFQIAQKALRVHQNIDDNFDTYLKFEDAMKKNIEWFLEEFNIKMLYLGVRHQIGDDRSKYVTYFGNPPSWPILPKGDRPDNYIYMRRGPDGELVLVQHLKHAGEKTEYLCGIDRRQNIFWKMLHLWIFKDILESCYHQLEQHYILSERGLDLPLTEIQKKYTEGTVDPNDDYDIAVICHPKYDIGGDVYLLEKQDSYVVALADISGKGIGAATMVPVVQYIAERETRNAGNLVEAAANFEKELCHVFEGTNMFATAILGILRPREFEYCRFGHEAIAVYRAANNNIGIVDRSKRGLIGFVPPDASALPDTIKLTSGDVVLLYTDGAIDNKNKLSQERGDSWWIAELLKKSAKMTAKEISESIYGGIVDFAGTNSLCDDLTLIVIKKK